MNRSRVVLCRAIEPETIKRKTPSVRTGLWRTAEAFRGVCALFCYLRVSIARARIRCQVKYWYHPSRYVMFMESLLILAKGGAEISNLGVQKGNSVLWQKESHEVVIGVPLLGDMSPRQPPKGIQRLRSKSLTRLGSLASN